jgi:hypothetical protein
MNFLLNLALASAIAFSTKPLGAQLVKPLDSGVKAADQRVRDVLEQSKVPYTIDDYGDFVVELKVGKSGRTQVTHIVSKTSTVQDVEWREVFSFGYRFTGTLDPKLAQKLLNKNSQMILGAWEVDQSEGKPGYAIFSVKIPAKASADVMLDAIDVSLSAADALEKELTGKDYF